MTYASNSILLSIVAMKQTLFSGFIQLAAGLSVGLSCLAGKISFFLKESMSESGKN